MTVFDPKLTSFSNDDLSASMPKTADASGLHSAIV
jgi:hypothetical protein